MFIRKVLTKSNFVDDQNLQEKKIEGISSGSANELLVTPLSPSLQPKITVFKWLYVLLALVFLLAVAAVFYYKFYKTQPKNLSSNNSKQENGQALSATSTLALDVLYSDYPTDLFFEAGVRVIKNDTSRSQDNKVVTIERAYESNRTLELNLKIMNYLHEKDWQIRDVKDVDSKEKSFTAVKDGNTAAIVITATDATHTLVDIKVSSQVK